MSFKIKKSKLKKYNLPAKLSQKNKKIMEIVDKHLESPLYKHLSKDEKKLKRIQLYEMITADVTLVGSASSLGTMLMGGGLFPERMAGVAMLPIPIASGIIFTKLTKKEKELKRQIKLEKSKLNPDERKLYNLTHQQEVISKKKKKLQMR
jgi:hypothetical protein